MAHGQEEKIGLKTEGLSTPTTHSEVQLVPIPSYHKLNGQLFELNGSTTIAYAVGLKEQAELLADALSPATGWDFKVIESKEPTSNSIWLSFDSVDHQEGYRLKVSDQTITIKGKNTAGIFYGIQTLLQLLPVEIYSPKRHKNTSWKVTGMEVDDYPVSSWRGMMLDVSRYFFDKDYVLRFLDIMSMHKMNVLHLHLIDDPGWRLEIKKYPRLTSVGAWRGDGHERYGGYYTHNDIREMVQYAAQRNIQIIPEVEVPAHTHSAVTAYPYLGCTSSEIASQTQYTISKEIYCPGKETTFEFLSDVFDEVAALFPSKYIHIGGDEARYDRWRNCPHCQKRKADLGITTEHELREYFDNRVLDILSDKGKTAVGWDEIIKENPKHNVVGYATRFTAGKAEMAADNGSDAVVAFFEYLYFDFPESLKPGEVKAANWEKGHHIPLKKVYAMGDRYHTLLKDYAPHILGAQGHLWTDQFIHGTELQEIGLLNENRSEKYLEYLTLPRMSALAEVIWSPKSKQNWQGFQQRMRNHYHRFQKAGLGFRVPEPKLVSAVEVQDSIEIKLERPVKDAEIRYTIDGTSPNVYSSVYQGPIKVKSLTDLKAITVVNNRLYSLPLELTNKP